MRTGQGADPKIAGSRLPLLLTLPNAPTVAAYTAAGFSGDETIPAFKVPQMHLSGRVSTIFASHRPPAQFAPRGVLSPAFRL